MKPNNQRQWVACTRGGEPASLAAWWVPFQLVHFRKNTLHHPRPSGHLSLPSEYVEVWCNVVITFWFLFSAVLYSMKWEHQAQVNLAGFIPAGSNISPSMQHASVCNKHLSMKQLQVLSSLKCKSCTPRNVPFKGKYTFNFVKQNLLFILFSGVQFHLFYLNSKQLFKQDYIKNQRRRKIHQRRQLMENTRIKISGCVLCIFILMSVPLHMISSKACFIF